MKQLIVCGHIRSAGDLHWGLFHLERGIKGTQKAKGLAETETIGKKMISQMRPSRIIIRDTDFKRTPSMKIDRNQRGES